MRSALAEVLGPARAEAACHADDMIAAGFLDSFAIVELAARLEAAFDVTIPSDAINDSNFASSRALARLIEGLERTP